MSKLNSIKSVLYALLLLVLLLRQMQMQSEINHLRESQLKLSQDMLEYMNSTNSSIKSNTEAIQSGTRTMKMLAGMKR